MPSPDPTAEFDANDVNSSLPGLVVIVGPTAVGKTKIAIELALRLEGEVVSADSRLFYRGMDIGTAKPMLAERKGVPHHLVDIANPAQSLSLAEFQRLAADAIAAIHARRRLPILVGGTGQYVRAVLHGWEAPAVVPDPHLRGALETWAKQIGTQGLHDRLAVLDATAACKIDHRNLRRTVRALEVIFTTGHLFSSQRRQGQRHYNVLIIGLMRPRRELYARIDARIDLMFQSGFVDEVSSLLQQGYTPDLPALSAIGYREVMAYLQGACSLDEAVTDMKRRTRIFVRRQANWFKAEDPEIHWFDVQAPCLSQIEAQIHAWHSTVERQYA